MRVAHCATLSHLAAPWDTSQRRSSDTNHGEWLPFKRLQPLSALPVLDSIGGEPAFCPREIGSEVVYDN